MACSTDRAKYDYCNVLSSTFVHCSSRVYQGSWCWCVSDQSNTWSFVCSLAGEENMEVWLGSE